MRTTLELLLLSAAFYLAGGVAGLLVSAQFVGTPTYPNEVLLRVDWVAIGLCTIAATVLGWLAMRGLFRRDSAPLLGLRLIGPAASLLVPTAVMALAGVISVNPGTPGPGECESMNLPPGVNCL